MREDERRAHSRVPAAGVAIRVRFSDVADLEQYYLRDISRGGIFLRTRNVRPVHTMLIVVLAMPDGEEIQLRGEVVHTVSAEEATPGRPSGMGVQFLDLTPEVKERIGSYVGRLRRRLPEAPPGGPAAALTVVTRSDSESGSGAGATAPVGGSGPPGPAAGTSVPEIPAFQLPTRAPSSPPAARPEPPPPAAHSGAARPVITGTAAFEEAGDRDLLRRFCWLLAEGGVLGRPIEELFGISRDAPAVLRREVYERIRKALAPERPPPFLGAEEARAIVRVLALLETLTREDP